MKCRDCKYSKYSAHEEIYFCDKVRPDLFGMYPRIDLDEDCMFDDRRMIKCRDCKYCANNHVPYCTNLKMHVHAEYDGCTFGIEKMTNGKKFEKIFGVSCHKFLNCSKIEDQLEWAKQEYKEPPCED